MGIRLLRGGPLSGESNSLRLSAACRRIGVASMLDRFGLSVVPAMLRSVLTTAALLAAYADARPDVPMTATGIAELDALTGGMVQGRVWVLTGTPGQGRSTLVTQWAASIAEGSDRAVQLVTPRDKSSTVASRLLSRICRVPLPHLVNRSLDGADEERLRLWRGRVAGLNLSIFSEGKIYVPEVHLAHHREAAAVFVDDAESVSGLTPGWVAACAANGLFVLIALPRHHVLTTADQEADVDPAWAGVADVVMEIRSRGLPNGTWRPGEAELDLHYNRWGFVRTIALQYQAHFSRFLEPPAPEQNP